MLEFLIQNWYLVLAAVVSGGMLLWPQFKGGGGASTVSTSEAVRLVNREKAQMVDVSEPDEFAASHVVGARNVPLGRLEGAKELPGNKNLPLVLVCPNGSRAARGAALLRKAGYEKAQSLAGGLAAWREANLPIEKSAA